MKANLGLSLFAFALILTTGCGRTSGDNSQVPYNGYGYPYGYGGGQGYMPYGGSAWGTSANGAAAIGGMTLTPAENEALRNELGSSNQLRLSDLIQLLALNSSNLETVGNGVTEATQIMSKARDEQVYQDMAALIEFLRQQIAALRPNASQSERRSCGQRIGGRLMESLKGLAGRLMGNHH